MFKLLLVAMSAAISNAAWNWHWNAFEDNYNNYLSFDMAVVADAFYSTTYTSADAHEEYGLTVQSQVDVTLSMEFFSWYTHSVIFHITPLKLVPYNQALTYDRPAANDGDTNVYVTGYREISIMDIQTEHYENMKTCTSSLYDTIAAQNMDKLVP